MFWDDDIDYTILNLKLIEENGIYGEMFVAAMIRAAGCNGATTGSILEVLRGIKVIPEGTARLLNDKVESVVFGHFL